MNYELAKELKDAGFPQPIGHLSQALTTDGDVRPYSNGELPPKDWVYLPTLSELIEACGEGFEYLNYEPVGKYDWYCNNVSDPEHPELDKPMTQGRIPEEAVARLWLALNKK